MLTSLLHVARRLAGHLGSAFLLYTGMLWSALTILLPQIAIPQSSTLRKLRMLSHSTKGTVFLTALSGQNVTVQSFYTTIFWVTCTILCNVHNKLCSLVVAVTPTVITYSGHCTLFDHDCVNSLSYFTLLVSYC